MQGMTAAAHLMNVAVEKRSALECIVLQSNIIDGSLRIGLILKRQLVERNLAVDETLLDQTDDDKAISERSIYKRCLSAGVIDQRLFNNLSTLYNKRNKCIHRYLLSDIDYDFATHLVFELDSVLDEVGTVINRLESEQVAQGIGMTVAGPSTTKEELRKFAAIKEKPYNLGS